MVTKKPLTFPDSEFVGGWRGSKSGCKEGNFSRASKVTSCHYTLTHTPTGLKLQGDIPPGNYPKKKMQELRRELHEKLKHDLTKLLMQRLRIPGKDKASGLSM